MFKKKILKTGAMLIATSLPLTTVVACEYQAKTAEENQIEKMLKDATGTTLAKQLFFDQIIANEIKDEQERERARKSAWESFSISQLMKHGKSFWMNKLNKEVADGVIKESEITGADVWIDTDGSKSQNPKNGFYLSYDAAKKIMNTHKTFGWSFAIDKLLLAKILFTTIKKEELETSDEKENSSNTLKGKFYAKETDAPTNIWRASEEQLELGLKEGEFLVKYFFLNKYLHENNPTFLWEVSKKADILPSVDKTIDSVKSFNEFPGHNLPLENAGKFIGNNVATSKDNTLTDAASQIYGFKGIQKTNSSFVSGEGEVDYSQTGLQKRMTDNLSESGFLNKDGNIDKTGGVVVSDDGLSAKIQFIKQFVPHFVAFNKDSIKLEIIKDNNFVWAVKKDKSTTPRQKNKKDLGADEIAVVGNKAGYLHLNYKDGEVISGTIESNKQRITDNNLLSKVDKNTSFFYADSKLLADKDNLEKLIFQLVLSDNSIFTESVKFMTKVRGYKLDVKSPILKEKLIGEDYLK